MEKLYASKAMLKMAGGGGVAFPTSPLDPPLHPSFIVPPLEKMLHYEKSLLGLFLTSGNLKQILTGNFESPERSNVRMTNSPLSRFYCKWRQK